MSPAKPRPTQAKGPKDADVVDQRLQALMDGLLSRPEIRHAIMAVEDNAGAFRWHGAVGDAKPDGTPMQVDTPFLIASVSKMYIAATILKLYERGDVGLDESLLAYLPETLIGGLHRLGGVDYTAAITIRHLLGHTSGLPDYIEERPKGGQSLVERLLKEGDMAWGIDEVVRIVRDELRPHFAPQPVEVKRPKARYSDTNYQLIIAILEVVTGQPQQQVFEDLLFRPLDLRHSYLPGHSPLDPTPEPATLWFGNEPMDIPLALASFRDLYSTLQDTLAFLRTLVGGEVFDDPATFELMQSRWNRFGFPRDQAALRAPGWPIEYGLGLMRFRLPRILTPRYMPPTVIGHSGSTGTWLFYCPQLDLLLSGAVDQGTAGAVPYQLIPKVLRVIDPATR
jgi:D-alanyl-D-alanine carboxypeptidase